METKIGLVRKILFKEYDQNQFVRLPIQIEEFIAPGHLVRIIDGVVEQIRMEELEVFYEGGGRSPYHPKLMIKVWVYGYCTRVYTTRPLARAIREQLPFMWLAGGQQPNFKTLSEFRGNRMQGMIDLIFKKVLAMLIEEGYVDLADLYVDGSKWEANANRHKIVWAKKTARYKAAVLDRIEGLLDRVRQLQAEEDLRYGQRDLEEVGEGKEVEIVLNSERVGAYLVSLNALIAEASADKVRQKELKKARTALVGEQGKLDKYEQQEQILDGRNSFSRTDVDATAMRMKDERLLPAYNVQHSTNNQFVVNYTIEQNASDSVTLGAHLGKMDERFEGLSVPQQQNLCGDAGYGSEENYDVMEGRNIKAYVKYPLFYQEQSGALVKRKFRRENFPYDEQADEFTCPNNRKLKYIGDRTDKSTTGYKKSWRLYECESCANCTFAAECKKSEEKNRTVRFSPKYEVYKAQAKKLLESDKGLQMRSERSIEVESGFGDLKYNLQHRRFVLRERKKVYIEFGLLAISHNLRKVFCEKSGIWAAYYAQRARKRA
ncbi:MAG: IS1182 family transposase [Haliscomenobacteraceae bacterium CHB4]|nr:IS1182 family transposase ISMsp1 [Saprospiraceae bacterium]MCE7924829.1 IS1182 family transposase [Haliscomenobacteraceae bacterium CHB4]